MHALPLQQPPVHDVVLHTHCPLLVLHAWPEPHGAQAAPPTPQTPSFCAE